MAFLQTRIRNGKAYYYEGTSIRVNGKPKTTYKYIGDKKALDARLFTTNNILKSYSYGDTYALLKIVEKLGLEKILDDILPLKIKNGIKRSTALILIALQRVCKPGSKMAFASWFKTTSLPEDMGISNPDILNSDFFWHQMDDISEQDLIRCENAIADKIFELYDVNLDKIALDYTNYFTYIDSNNEASGLAKRGHNKQKRDDLKQISLAVITVKDLCIPLYTYTYEGNTNDKTAFKNYIELLKMRIPNYKENELTLVFDGGSVSKDNLDLIENGYVCRFSLNSCKDLYDISIDEKILINDKEITFKRISNKVVWDKERELILTFSEKLYIGEEKELEEKIIKITKEFDELKEKLESDNNRIKRAPNYIESKINVMLKSHLKDIISYELIIGENNKVINLNYKIDNDKKAEIKNKYFGKKVIMTNRKDWSTEEILKTYYDQDCIESIFKESKKEEHFKVRPIYHWTDSKIRVHIFCSILGLQLIGLLNKEMLDKKVKISNYKLIETLSLIRRASIINGKKITKQLEKMENDQIKIWKLVEAIC